MTKPSSIQQQTKCSMYGIFTYMYQKFKPNVGKYTIHGTYRKLAHESLRHSSTPLRFGIFRYPKIAVTFAQFPFVETHRDRESCHGSKNPHLKLTNLSAGYDNSIRPKRVASWRTVFHGVTRFTNKTNRCLWRWRRNFYKCICICIYIYTSWWFQPIWKY